MNRRVSVETIGHAPCRAWPRGDTRTDGWSAAPNRRAELRRSAGVTAGRQFLPLVLSAPAGMGNFSNILSRAGGSNRKRRCPRYSRGEGSWRDARGRPYKNYARHGGLAVSLVKGAFALLLRRPPYSRSVNRLTPRVRTMLAHLPHTQCSTTYCSRTVSFFFLTPALISRARTTECSFLRRSSQRIRLRSASRVRTTEISSCLSGARRTRTLDLHHQCVKRIRALSHDLFSLVCGQLTEVRSIENRRGT